MANAKPSDTRKARKFLFQRGFTPREISPKDFAEAAKTRNQTFGELLKYIARLMTGSQGEGQAPRSSRLALKGKNAAAVTTEDLKGNINEQ